MSFHSGERVRHITQDRWGIGQVREDSSGEFTKVFFTEAGEKTIKTAFLKRAEGTEAESAILDNLKKDASKKSQYRTISQLREWFLTMFPDGFYGNQYLDRERNYKVKAHEFFRAVLNRNAYLELLNQSGFDEITRRAMQVINKTNLVFPNEKMALKDGLKDAAAQKTFAGSLFDLLFGESDLQPRFEAFADVLERIGAAKWTVMTYFPFIFAPGDHMFVKPTVTQAAADICMFELNYRSDLNWSTYHHVLRFSNELLTKLSDLKPRDFIDIQSFIWCAERIADGAYGKDGSAT